MNTCRQPCAACPWRVANHGKRHKHSFYTKRNLRRLWNQVRKGGGIQSCHPTDPGHPDHGAKEDSTALECAGSVILVTRELRNLQRLESHGKEAFPMYKALYGRGLTMEGVFYHAVARNVPKPIGPGEPLPLVKVSMLDDPTYGRPQ